MAAPSLSSSENLAIARGTPTPLESGGHGMVAGILLTTREVLLQPRRFFSQLGNGELRAPLAFAALALALPIAVAELGALQQGETESAGVAVLRTVSLPLVAAVWVAYVQGSVWHRVLRLFAPAVPFRVAARGMSYLTALVGTLGLVMSIAGFAPESGPYVIAWYAALDLTLLLAFYALIAFARGPYRLSLGRALAAVLCFELAYAITLFAATLTYFALFAPSGT